jgi:Na+-transporting methylmalonyl-CoA/oxaloacetate decarboxylase gamma subunit
MDDLIWGLQMSGLGMGLVFGLLALLWGLLTIVLRLDRPPMATSLPASAPMSDLDPELVAAIMVATLAHRAQQRREAAPVMRSYWPGSLLYASRWLGAGRARQNTSWQRRGR